MKAREKFIARLEELGIYEKWNTSRDFAGKVMPDGTVVLLVHYDYDNDDEYNEIHYPSFDELRENEEFRKACRSEFFTNDDDHFVAELAQWLEFGSGYTKCPLYPEDLYFAASGLETEFITFQDDQPIEILTRMAKELYGTDKVTVTINLQQ